MTTVMRTLPAVVLKTQPDRKLVSLAAEGSEAAFETLVQRYRRALQAYCRRLLLSDARSEDVVQQSLLNAWEALRSGTEVREPRAWLYRITHNQALNARRQPEYDFAQLGESLRVAAAPEVDLERRVVMRQTLTAVAALPERQREAILGTAVEGQSYEEVAAAMGLSSTAVRGLVYRARNALRAGLAAVTPAPLVGWAASRVSRSGNLEQLLGMAAGSGSAGGAALALKGATILATSAALVGGTVTGSLKLQLIPGAHERYPVGQPAPGPSASLASRTGGAGAPPPASTSFGVRLAALPFVSRRVSGSTSPASVAWTPWAGAAPGGRPVSGEQPGSFPVSWSSPSSTDSSPPGGGSAAGGGTGEMSAGSGGGGNQPARPAGGSAGSGASQPPAQSQGSGLRPGDQSGFTEGGMGADSGPRAATPQGASSTPAPGHSTSQARQTAGSGQSSFSGASGVDASAPGHG